MLKKFIHTFAAVLILSGLGMGLFEVIEWLIRKNTMLGIGLSVISIGFILLFVTTEHSEK